MADGPASQITVAARVAEQLAAEIRQGAFDAGMPLRQNDIATRMGVSSTPVREAFHILERLGLVRRQGRRGVRVFRPSAVDLINGYQVRQALEPLAARLATPRATELQLATLHDVLERMHAPDAGTEAYIHFNALFHGQIAAASGNPRLAELIATEDAATGAFVTFLRFDPNTDSSVQHEHATILSAMEDRDADAAAQAMSAHLLARMHSLEARLTAIPPPVLADGRTAVADENHR